MPHSHEMYCHCSECFGAKPHDVSPRDWGKLAVFVEGDRIVIWCNRCDHKVVSFQLVDPPDPECETCAEHAASTVN